MGETESILLRTFSKVGKNVFCEKETFYKWKVRPERTNSVAVREGKWVKLTLKIDPRIAGRQTITKLFIVDHRMGKNAINLIFRTNNLKIMW